MGLHVLFCHWAIKDLGLEIWSLPTMGSLHILVHFLPQFPLGCLIGVSHLTCPEQTLISLFLISLIPTPPKVFFMLVCTPFFQLLSPKLLESFLKKFFFFFYILLIFERERKTEHKWGRGRERGRHRIPSRLQALSCQHRARRRAQTQTTRS